MQYHSTFFYWHVITLHFETINVGDSLEFLSNGFYKSTIHRVVQPPPDQHTLERLAIFYFGMPNDDVVLAPTTVGSHGCEAVERAKERGELIKLRYGSIENAPIMDDWRRGVMKGFGYIELEKGEEPGVEVFKVNGVDYKHYD